MVEGQEVVEGDDGGDVAECAGEGGGERAELRPDRRPTADVPSVDPNPPPGNGWLFMLEQAAPVEESGVLLFEEAHERTARDWPCCSAARLVSRGPSLRVRQRG